MLGQASRLAVATFLFCFTGSVLMGFLVYGDSVFDSSQVFFQFVGSGLLGAALVAAARVAGLRAVALVVLIGYPVLLISNGSFTGARLLRDAVGVAGLSGAVLAGMGCNRFFPRRALGKFVIWAAIFGGVHLAMYAILCLANGQPIDSSWAELTARIGALIGGGLGLGFELSALVWEKMKGTSP